MGIACPPDEPGYATMVESSGGGSCRCACGQDEFQDQQQSSCCSPHVFTSVLLGILSCVLMTGGVFLAFHRWDPMWLMVSGVGVVLILIGTLLHCCNNLSQGPKRHSSSAGKGCCSRPIPPDHGGHMIANSGSLTEQLLPLSNARSVSQLSLNMLPGYFPPVVTAYGIEQHSAVVHNINRLVQQQQQQPQSPSSICPSSAAGKSFIVLTLPSDTPAANIQNLVATIYQLDGNSAEPTVNESVPNLTPPIILKPNPPVPLILKNAEVQTSSMWPSSPATAVASTSGENHVAARSPQTDGQPPSSQAVVTTATCGSTQTEDIPPVLESINLMDCSTDIAPICDNSTSTCDIQPTDSNSALVNIPPTCSNSVNLLDVSSSTPGCASDVLVDIPETEDLLPPSVANLLVEPAPASDCPEVLVDILDDSGVCASGGATAPLLSECIPSTSAVQQTETVSEAAAAAAPPTADTLLEVPESTNSNLQHLNPELLASSGNLSATDTEIDDDGELLDRSSPPPSYEDVTLEGESVGAFGLAYGTI